MKILLLTDRLDIGGAETHIAQLATELVRLGMQVWVASQGGETADRLEALGVPQIRLPLGTHSPIKWLILRRKLRTFIKEERIEIAHAHARIPALLIRGARRLGCGEIVTVHAKFRHGPLLRRLSYWGEESIAVSEDLRTYLHDVYAIPLQRIRVIPNGIDLARFSIEDRNESISSHRILFASRLDDDCALGAELLCDIAPQLCKRIPNLCITIAGGGKKMPEIAARAKKINQECGDSCIRVCGTVQDMANLARKNDIFVGVSRAALEAAACGCAVILCGNEGYGGILRKDNFHEAALTNFCARGEEKPTAAHLEEDLLTLLRSHPLCRHPQDECRTLIAEGFDARLTTRETLSVYRRNLHPRPTKTLTVGGYFGCGNLGDDAILQAFIEYTRTHHPDMRILPFTKNPRRDMHRFGVLCASRKNPVSILTAFLKSDVFLCGGGSLLQNVTGRLSLHYYLCMLRLARLCGALPILFAAGIGPVHGKKARTAMQKVLARCAYISLRDADSLRFLSTLGIDRAKLHLGADMALLLPPPPVFRTNALLKQIDVLQNQPYVCVCLKDGKLTRDSRCTIIAALRMLCRKEGLIPVFLPLDSCDYSVNATAAKILGGRLFCADEPSDVTALLRSAQCLISMRLHGLVLATTVTLPAIGIPTADDQKIPSFARIAAQEFLAPEELSVVALVEICQKICHTSSSLRPLIADACLDLQKNAQKDLANIAAMVYNKDRYFKKSEETI